MYRYSRFSALLSISLYLLISVVVSSCTNSTAQTAKQIDEFVINAQLNSKNYTNEQWQESKKEYDKLIAEYEKEIDKFSAEDKQRVANAIGRYHALMVENALNQSADTLKSVLESFAEIANIMPSYIEGFKDILQKDSVSISKVLSSVLQSDQMKSAAGGLGSIIKLIDENSTKIDSVVNSSNELDLLKLLGVDEIDLQGLFEDILK